LREIRASGFTPARIEVRARGVVERDDSVLRLRVADRAEPLVLTGGAQFEKLDERATDPGDTWVIIGLVEIPKDDSPLRLSVETIEE